jgi:hypothetical protein
MTGKEHGELLRPRSSFYSASLLLAPLGCALLLLVMVIPAASSGRPTIESVQLGRSAVYMGSEE